jgi:hypothetical protein
MQIGNDLRHSWQVLGSQGCFTKQDPVSNHCYLPDNIFTYALPQQLTKSLKMLPSKISDDFNDHLSNLKGAHLFCDGVSKGAVSNLKHIGSLEGFCVFGLSNL